MNVILGIGLIFALIFATAGALKIFPAVARAVLGEDPPERITSMDGLRGLLALSVFLHHIVISHGFFAGYPWRPPPHRFDNLVGRAAVALFFMISGYLFWGRVVRNRGRLNWFRFFKGRVLRLAPLFYASDLLLFAIVAIETRFTLRVPVAQLARQVGIWLSFGFCAPVDINGLKGTFTILSTQWTLEYEWIFYLSLPFLALLYRFTRRDWLIYPVIFALSLWAGGRWRLCAFFATGFIAVHILNLRPTAVARTLWMWAGTAALAVLCGLYRDEVGIVQILLIFLIFIAAIQAAGPWAVMRWRPVRYLGHISYSVYLLHNPVIHVFAKWIFGATRYGSLNLPELYGAAFLTGLGVIALSTFTFVYVEKPFFYR